MKARKALGLIAIVSLLLMAVASADDHKEEFNILKSETWPPIMRAKMTKTELSIAGTSDRLVSYTAPSKASDDPGTVYVYVPSFKKQFQLKKAPKVVVVSE